MLQPQQGDEGAWETDGAEHTVAEGWDKTTILEGTFHPLRHGRTRRFFWLVESRRSFQRAGGVEFYRIIPKHLQTFVSQMVAQNAAIHL